ncbi:hypothetical protein TNIN_364211 [Trichonephila inaurata madagascariensis]|uniref:Uncharacterized protein n=1 Tax=Trichonephila inaurata madagascariensis TaxID=2747483 RepID=A0A8X6WZS7_9ARAC|nr:hypothetical protein TNIN_364211 [Trichonephila inaurata madagascariensis]
MLKFSGFSRLIRGRFLSSPSTTGADTSASSRPTGTGTRKAVTGIVGSPTETLLRLLPPLSGQVRANSPLVHSTQQEADGCGGAPPPFNRNSDGRWKRGMTSSLEGLTYSFRRLGLKVQRRYSLPPEPGLGFACLLPSECGSRFSGLLRNQTPDSSPVATTVGHPTVDVDKADLEGCVAGSTRAIGKFTSLRPPHAALGRINKALVPAPGGRSNSAACIALNSPIIK